MRHCIKLIEMYDEILEATLKVDFNGSDVHIFLSIFAIMNLVKIIHIN